MYYINLSPPTPTPPLIVENPGGNLSLAQLVDERIMYDRTPIVGGEPSTSVEEISYALLHFIKAKYPDDEDTREREINTLLSYIEHVYPESHLLNDLNVWYNRLLQEDIDKNYPGLLVG